MKFIKKITVTAIALFFVLTSFAQEGKTKLTDPAGVWIYQGVVVDTRPGSNVFLKAGVTAIAPTIIATVDQNAEKAGIKKGSTQIRFSNKKASTTVEGTTHSVDYAFKEDNSTILFSSHGYEAKGRLAVGDTESSRTIFFDASELLSLISVEEREADPTISALAALISSYDGLQMGIVMHKK